MLITFLIQGLSFFFILVAVGLIGYVWFIIRNQQTHRKPITRLRSTPHRIICPLENRLVNTLLNGDARAAQRLVVSAQRMHPGRESSWYLEKVIYDLERDRR